MASARLPKIGDLIGTKYLIERELGAGGVGTVFLAIDQLLGRPVAIKVVDPAVANDPQVEARFQNEARLARHLTHPNTIQIFDFGRLETGLPFMVMEFLRGQDIQTLIDTQGAFSVDRTMQIGRQILSSLAEAHSCGIIHRDLKPSNIIVGDFGGREDYVKVLDFGIAKVLDEHADGEDIKTRAGLVVGSPAYMAPERLRGRELTPSSDLFSWGILVAEMLSGTSIYGNKHILQILATHADVGPIPLPQVVLSSSMGSLIERVTKKNPEERTQTALEVISELDSLADMYESTTLGAQHNVGVAHLSMEPTKQMPSLFDAPTDPSDPARTGPYNYLDDGMGGVSTWPMVYRVLLTLFLFILIGGLGVLVGLAIS